MYELLLKSLVNVPDPGEVTQLLGPEVRNPAQNPFKSENWQKGQLLRCGAFDLYVVRGPIVLDIDAQAPSWILLSPFCGSITFNSTDHRGQELVFGELLFLSPGATSTIELGKDAAVEIFVAPPQIGQTPIRKSDGKLIPRGLSWSIVKKQIEPSLKIRDKVKVAEPNLWRPESPSGSWQNGSEIRCESVAFGFFRTGAPETAHLHQRTWEFYQAIEGELEMNVRTHRLGPWEPITVESGNALVLPPGTAHLVDASCQHLSMAVQVPPAISDRETASFSQVNPSAEMTFDE